MSTALSTDSREDSITISASPAKVYAVVCDVTRTGEWSPVCQECWWEDGAGPVVGAWFGGRNESGGRTWETRSQVTEAEPGVVFAWQVGGRYASWAYRLAPVAGGGTRLTETWELGETTKEFFAEKYGERAEEVLDQRRREAQEGIPATLARIKEIVEQD